MKFREVSDKFVSMGRSKFIFQMNGDSWIIPLKNGDTLVVALGALL